MGLVMTEDTKEAAQAKLVTLKAELKSADDELSSWYHHDLNRRDGSGAQDRRHEERGDSLKERLYQAGKKVEAQEQLIASLGN